jgi:hypothetical protein
VWLKEQTFISYSLEAGKCLIKVPAGPVSGEGPSPGNAGGHLPGPHLAEAKPFCVFL